MDIKNYITPSEAQTTLGYSTKRSLYKALGRGDIEGYPFKYNNRTVITLFTKASVIAYSERVRNG